MKSVKEAALGRHLFGGTWLNMGSAISSEIAGITGFDWALIDLEHGSGDFKDLYYQLLALEASSTAAIVRVPRIDASTFNRVLELGPAGLMIPSVHDRTAAERIVESARIAPLGTRGVATSTRAVGYGLSYAEYRSECNENLILVAQIESIDGLTNVDSVADVDGIDVLFVGPTDLSLALGCTDKLEDDIFRAALMNIAEAAQRSGKTAGALVRDPQDVPEYLSLGYTFLSVGSDRSSIYKGMEQTNNMFRSLKERSRG